MTPVNSAASTAAPASRHIHMSPRDKASSTLDAIDKANDAMTKASALLNVLSASFDSELGSFVPRDGDVWVSVLATLDLVDAAQKALAGANLVDVVQQELAAQAHGPA